MKWTLIVMAVALLNITPTAAQTLATVRVKSEKIAAGVVILVLASGTVIEIPESDLYGLVTGGLQAPLSQTTPPPPPIAPPHSSPVLPPISTPAPLPAIAPVTEAPPTIRAGCEKEWPNDLRMQVFCIGRQQEALRALTQRDMSVGARAVIRQQCTAQWPDDYRMQNSCEERQLQGQQLGR